MSNRLILCEGKTDAILLSYYLEKTCGWRYSRSAPHGVNIRVNKKNGETAEWYCLDGEFLLICAVGSKSSFKRFFHEKIRTPLFVSDAFSKIALLLDRDEEAIEDIEKTIQEDLAEIASDARNNQWSEGIYNNQYGEQRQVEFLLQIIPCEQQGALETLLLEAISEDSYDRNIVEKSRLYVDELAPEADRYIGKRRLVLKAYLGVVWAIQSPQKVFDFIDEQLRAVPWECSDVLSNIFENLRKI